MKTSAYYYNCYIDARMTKAETDEEREKLQSLYVTEADEYEQTQNIADDGS